MPKIKLDKVISFSTEDPVHPAENLLNPNPAKKWKCKTPGEISANIVIQLEKACVISNIDIGNEHSAYIEILVARSSQSDDFKELLVMSSFMTPVESRSSENVNKVRMFTVEDLSKPECEQKWDRIKIVCTQPFNKKVQYGLSFITLHCIEDNDGSNANAHIGKFLIRSESPDDLSPGSLFARRKELKSDDNEKPLTAAAAIRKASSKPSTPTHQRLSIKQRPNSPATSKTVTDSTVSNDRNRTDILYDKEDDDPNDKIDEIIKKKLAEDETKKNKEIDKQQKTKDKKKDRDEHRDKDKETKRKDKKETNGKDKKEERSKDKKTTQMDDVRGSRNKRKSDLLDSANKKVKRVENAKSFNQLLNGVVLVISGIQNPDRADLRDKVLSMGGRYKADWDSNCTHLICAFPNTPKFNQVKGKGKIVIKKWLTECHLQRKRLPWRRYALDRDDKYQTESEDEICEKSEKEDNNGSTINDNGSDTEDEIERIKAKQTKHKKILVDDEEEDEKPSTSKTFKQILSDDEDDEIDNKNDLTNNKIDFEGKHYKLMPIDSQNSPDSEANFIKRTQEDEADVKKLLKRGKLPTLGDFYDGKKFYIDTNMSDADIAKIAQYIYASKGQISDDINSCDFKIANYNKHSKVKGEDWISSDWIWDCYNHQKLRSTDDFRF